MARTIDTTVTGNLSAIIRLMETGPKICQKYIEQPALFRGKKFDLRYIVLVRSINPLELFITDIFWVCIVQQQMKPISVFCFHFLKIFLILFQVRLANNTYTLDKKSLFEYETHFTVMVIFLVLDPTLTDVCSRKQLLTLMTIFFQSIRITGEH